MTNRHETIETIRELSKSACGFRVNYDWNSFSDAWLDDELKYFSDAVELEISKEKDSEAHALVAFEKHISDMCRDYGIDRNTAIRWDKQACGFENFDLDHYLWDKGIGYDDSLRISRSYNV